MRYLIAVLVFLAGCRNTTPPSARVKGATDHVAAKEVTPQCDSRPGDANSGAYWAVLEKINPILGPMVDDASSFAEADAAEFQLKCVDEFAKTIQDPCVRQEYGFWINVYERQLREKRVSIADGHSKDDSYDRDQRKRDEAATRFMSTHVIPRPPESCIRIGGPTNPEAKQPR